MSVLPGVTGKQLVAALRKAGFDVVRIKGSHHFLRHADGRTTVVPVHAELSPRERRLRTAGGNVLEDSQSRMRG